MNKCGYSALAILTVIAVLAGGLLLWRVEVKRTYFIPILMYHDIGGVTNSPWCVPEETFRAQMASLRGQGYQTILPADLMAHHKWGKPLPRKPLMLTFDDGYLSILKTVEPILQKNRFRAIAYLITARVAETPAERQQYEGKPCLVWPEAQAIQQRGVFVFGGHSHEHVNLAGTPNPIAQITECKEQLRRHGIRKPYSFCYPY